jgi:uncharacterized protein with HEPN domain
MKDDTLYLRHIMECIRRIEEDVAVGHDRFMASHTNQDAVLRNLQTMSEATQRLSDDAKRSHPEIDWRAVSAFRNVLVHDYLGVDLQKTWEIALTDVPDLKRAVAALLTRKN